MTNYLVWKEKRYQHIEYYELVSYQWRKARKQELIEIEETLKDWNNKLLAESL
jgi:hypothetical protein